MNRHMNTLPLYISGSSLIDIHRYEKDEIHLDRDMCVVIHPEARNAIGCHGVGIKEEGATASSVLVMLS
jgi:hypothetical protein